MNKLKLIRGSKDRAEEVKAILKSWGATDTEKWYCDVQDNYYYVVNGEINCMKTNSCLLPYLSYEVVELPQPKEEVRYFFKPFEKVLVRDEIEEQWDIDFFSHYECRESHPYYCIGNFWKRCIPYEGNEHLFGTTNEPGGGEK